MRICPTGLSISSLKPALVASLQGQGGKNAPGIVVPVKVEGPLDHPSYTPDFAAMLKDNLTDPGRIKRNRRRPQRLSWARAVCRTRCASTACQGGVLL